ncbi:MAG: ZIP family metal transporter [Patescibacteria group bacterium]|nr:ZIP family metal transporter [Patescibacteria group bacterium]
MIWIYTLTSVIVVSLISLVGVLFLLLKESRLQKYLSILVALATGALFGDALLHLLPEIFSEAENTLLPSILVLGGILLFFVLEKFLRWSHSHELTACDCPPEGHKTVKTVGQLSLVSDGFHNLLDGVIIAASYLVSPPIGIATTIAVILHEIPQEIGDFAILIHSGFSKARALLFNLFSGSLAILGAVVTLLIGVWADNLTTILLPIAAGGFLYLAGSDLVPELHKTTGFKKSIFQLIAFLIGIAAMLLLLFLE